MDRTFTFRLEKGNAKVLSKVQYYVDHITEKKVSVLGHAGFACERQLKVQSIYAYMCYDVLVFAREV